MLWSREFKGIPLGSLKKIFAYPTIVFAFIKKEELKTKRTTCKKGINQFKKLFQVER